MYGMHRATLSDFCFLFIFFNLLMISKKFNFSLSCFSPSSTPSFLCKGVIYESLLKMSSEADVKGQERAVD